MSINQLKDDIAAASKQIKEVEARQEALAAVLEPAIERYFTSRVQNEKNPELRRDFAYFNQSKNFDILDENTLQFKARNRSGPIALNVNVSDLVD